jgi:hypothetical protein
VPEEVLEPPPPPPVAPRATKAKAEAKAKAVAEPEPPPVEAEAGETEELGALGAKLIEALRRTGQEGAESPDEAEEEEA